MPTCPGLDKFWNLKALGGPLIETPFVNFASLKRLDKMSINFENGGGVYSFTHVQMFDHNFNICLLFSGQDGSLTLKNRVMKLMED